MKRLLNHLFLVTGLFTSVIVHAQIDYFGKYTVNGLSLNAGFSLSQITNGCKFSSQGTVLQRQFISYGDYSSENWDWHFKLQYRFKKKYAIEAGFIKSQIDFAYADKAFAATISDSNYIGGFNFTQNYIAPTISAYYFLSLPSASEYLLNLYVAGGINFNFNTNRIFSAPAPFYSNSAQQYVTASNQELDFNIHANSFFMQYYLESGINFCLYRCNLYVGAKYNFSQDMMNGTYQHFQNGNMTYSDHVSSSCDYFSGTVRVGYILFQKWDNPKDPRAKKHRFINGPKFKTKYIEPKY
ncbi:MAG TPA: hypothetical protein VK796_13665 [Cytophaga sp.]|nr:hypothetical protein [Cytophaga sp.]